MKAFVDKEQCIGCGLCASICPEVFKMDGEKAVAEDLDVEGISCAKDAKDGCPVSAISIE